MTCHQCSSLLNHKHARYSCHVQIFNTTYIFMHTHKLACILTHTHTHANAQNHTVRSTKDFLSVLHSSFPLNSEYISHGTALGEILYHHTGCQETAGGATLLCSTNAVYIIRSLKIINIIMSLISIQLHFQADPNSLSNNEVNSLDTENQR